MTSQRILPFFTVLFLIFGLAGVSHAALIVLEPIPGEFVVLDEDTNLMWLQNANLAGTTMNWDTAVAWADNLSYAGYDDWRLPTTPGTYVGMINEGEMGHLYYDEGINSSSQFPFTNVIDYFYWTGTEVATQPEAAWVFVVGGIQTWHDKGAPYYAWAVRSVPEPASLASFVTRFYQQCLNRAPDQAGLDYWVDSLLDRSLTGADVASGFVFSQEFVGLNTTNEEYLNVLYRAFFDRDPDSGGYNYWLSQLNSGMSREDVLDGFIYAQEFVNLCNSYGIIAFRTDSRALVEAFVTRFYQECLNRSPDQAGLDYWVNSLLDGTLTGADVAWGFVFSPEFTNLNTSNADYVTVLYRAFFDREPDSGGNAYWLSELNSGVSREDVLDGFIYAPEFEDLCSLYGIIPFPPQNCPNIAGLWFGTRTDNFQCCRLCDSSGEFYFTIAQRGCEITFIGDFGPSYPIMIGGNEFSFYELYYLGYNGEVQGTWNITISGDGTVLNGSASLIYSDFPCANGRFPICCGSLSRITATPAP